MPVHRFRQRLLQTDHRRYAITATHYQHRFARIAGKTGDFIKHHLNRLRLQGFTGFQGATDVIRRQLDIVVDVVQRHVQALAGDRMAAQSMLRRA